MMRRNTFTAIILSASVCPLFIACGYDDTQIKNDITELQSTVTSISDKVQLLSNDLINLRNSEVNDRADLNTLSLALNTLKENIFISNVSVNKTGDCTLMLSNGAKVVVKSQVISGVSDQPDKISFLLPDGTTIEIPRVPQLSFNLNLGSGIIGAGATSDIPYTISGNVGESEIETIAEGDISSSVVRTTDTEGVIKVTASPTFEKGKILAFASNNGRTVMKSIYLEKGVLTAENESYLLEEDGGNIAVVLSHNMKYDVSIDVNWISFSGTKAVVTETLSFAVAANTGSDRTGHITIKSVDDNESVTITVEQKKLFALTPESCTLMEGSTQNLSLTNNLDDKNVTWSSSNTRIATVSQDGIITAVKSGNATITVASVDGIHKKSCKVTVKGINDLITTYCSGGSFMSSGTLLLYGSTMNWYVTNNSSKTITVKSVQMIDGETHVEGNVISINETIKAGGSAGWGLRPGIAGIHYPVTVNFVILYDGKEYTISGVYKGFNI